MSKAKVGQYSTARCTDGTRWWTDGAVLVRYRHPVPPALERDWPPNCEFPARWLTGPGRKPRRAQAYHRRFETLIRTAERLDEYVFSDGTAALRCWRGDRVVALVMPYVSGPHPDAVRLDALLGAL